jgi:hypothetical protein
MCASARSLRGPIDPALAADRLADWGFVAHADLPDGDGDAYLLVGLRATPSLTHFDPEQMDVWVSRGSRGTRLQVTRETRPLETDYSWGTVTISDRLGVSNEYVTFGGRLVVAPADDMTVVILTSPVPILRRGGHSQGWDQAAVDLAVFFGRVMIAIDYIPGFEAQMTDASPSARYAAFIAYSIDRLRTSAILRAEYATLWTLVGTEERRLQAQDPAAWADGLALLAAAGLARPA